MTREGKPIYFYVEDSLRERLDEYLDRFRSKLKDAGVMLVGALARVPLPSWDRFDHWRSEQGLLADAALAQVIEAGIQAVTGPVASGIEGGAMAAALRLPGDAGQRLPILSAEDLKDLLSETLDAKLAPIEKRLDRLEHPAQPKKKAAKK